jgi:lipoprotein-anchoring transpeptidase ErfK/SrfK
MHYSKKYHHSPMPHSIFFNGGFAIHGTYDLRDLGQPASHGCVRISPVNAATLFALVREEGATIAITGETPPGRVRAAEPNEVPVMRIFGVIFSR